MRYFQCLVIGKNWASSSRAPKLITFFYKLKIIMLSQSTILWSYME
jgi:hypothetical protein